MGSRELQGQPFHLQDQNINSLHCTLYIPYNVSFKNSVSNQALSPLSCFFFLLIIFILERYPYCLRNFLLPTPGSKQYTGLFLYHVTLSRSPNSLKAQYFFPLSSVSFPSFRAGLGCQHPSSQVALNPKTQNAQLQHNRQLMAI